MEEDSALFAAEYASKLGADYADVRLEDHYNQLITVANDKVQRGIINRKHGMGTRTLVNDAGEFQSKTNLTKKNHIQAAEITFINDKSVKQTCSNARYCRALFHLVISSLSQFAIESGTSMSRLVHCV